MVEFAHKAVVLTGGSEGIGRALALLLAKQNAKLVVAGRNAERLTDLAKECEALGAECLTVAGDLGERENCKRLIDAAVDKFNGIDALINNAGITMWANFSDTTDPELIDKVMNVNFMSAANCTHYALPYLKKSRGRLVAVTSVAGIIGVPGHAIYGASKHAMTGFFNALRVELKADGVSVTIVAPDFVRTEIHVRGLDAKGQAMGKRIDEKNMSADECAQMMLDAITKRRRMLITSARGRLAFALRDIVPGIVDAVTAKSVKGHNLLD